MTKTLTSFKSLKVKEVIHCGKMTNKKDLFKVFVCLEEIGKKLLSLFKQKIKIKLLKMPTVYSKDSKRTLMTLMLV